MPSITLPIFSFAAVYAGEYGASVPMIPLSELRTNGAAMRESLPTTYERVLLNSIQSGNHTFEIDLEFYTDDYLTGIFARGLPFSASNINQAPAQTNYTLLLVPADGTLLSTWFFPQVRTLCSRDLNYKKNVPTSTKITFIGENRDPNVALFYQDNLSDIISILPAGTSPF